MQGLKMRQEATKIKLDAAATKLLNAEKASLADAKDKAAHLLAMQAAVHAQEKATREAGQNAAKLSEQDTKARDAAEVKFSAALQAKNKTEAELEHKIEEQNRLGGEESKKAELKFQVKMATLKRSQGKIEEEQKKQKETVMEEEAKVALKAGSESAKEKEKEDGSSAKTGEESMKKVTKAKFKEEQKEAEAAGSEAEADATKAIKADGDAKKKAGKRDAAARAKDAKEADDEESAQATASDTTKKEQQAAAKGEDSELKGELSKAKKTREEIEKAASSQGKADAAVLESESKKEKDSSDNEKRLVAKTERDEQLRAEGERAAALKQQAAEVDLSQNQAKARAMEELKVDQAQARERELKGKELSEDLEKARSTMALQEKKLYDEQVSALSQAKTDTEKTYVASRHAALQHLLKLKNKINDARTKAKIAALDKEVVQVNDATRHEKELVGLAKERLKYLHDTADEEVSLAVQSATSTIRQAKKSATAEREEAAKKQLHEAKEAASTAEKETKLAVESKTASAAALADAKAKYEAAVAELVRVQDSRHKAFVQSRTDAFHTEVTDKAKLDTLVDQQEAAAKREKHAAAQAHESMVLARKEEQEEESDHVQADRDASHLEQLQREKSQTDEDMLKQLQARENAKRAEASIEEAQGPKGTFECEDGTWVFDTTNCPDGGAGDKQMELEKQEREKLARKRAFELADARMNHVVDKLTTAETQLKQDMHATHGDLRIAALKEQREKALSEVQETRSKKLAMQAHNAWGDEAKAREKEASLLQDVARAKTSYDAVKAQYETATMKDGMSKTTLEARGKLEIERLQAAKDDDAARAKQVARAAEQAVASQKAATDAQLQAATEREKEVTAREREAEEKARQAAMFKIHAAQDAAHKAEATAVAEKKSIVSSAKAERLGLEEKTDTVAEAAVAKGEAAMQSEIQRAQARLKRETEVQQSAMDAANADALGKRSARAQQQQKEAAIRLQEDAAVNELAGAVKLLSANLANDKEMLRLRLRESAGKHAEAVRAESDGKVPELAMQQMIQSARTLAASAVKLEQELELLAIKLQMAKDRLTTRQTQVLKARADRARAIKVAAQSGAKAVEGSWTAKVVEKTEKTNALWANAVNLVGELEGVHSAIKAKKAVISTEKFDAAKELLAEAPRAPPAPPAPVSTQPPAARSGAGNGLAPTDGAPPLAKEQKVGGEHPAMAAVQGKGKGKGKGKGNGQSISLTHTMKAPKVEAMTATKATGGSSRHSSSDGSGDESGDDSGDDSGDESGDDSGDDSDDGSGDGSGDGSAAMQPQQPQQQQQQPQQPMPMQPMQPVQPMQPMMPAAMALNPMMAMQQQQQVAVMQQQQMQANNARSFDAYHRPVHGAVHAIPAPVDGSQYLPIHPAGGVAAPGMMPGMAPVAPQYAPMIAPNMPAMAGMVPGLPGMAPGMPGMVPGMPGMVPGVPQGASLLRFKQERGPPSMDGKMMRFTEKKVEVKKKVAKPLYNIKTERESSVLTDPSPAEAAAIANHVNSQHPQMAQDNFAQGKAMRNLRSQPSGQYPRSR